MEIGRENKEGDNERITMVTHIARTGPQLSSEEITSKPKQTCTVKPVP
jgi:hypothetical protein